MLEQLRLLTTGDRQALLLSAKEVAAAPGTALVREGTTQPGLIMLVEGSASGLDGGLPGVDLATYAADSVALGTVATAPGAMVGEDKAVGVAFDESTSGARVRGVRLDGGAWSLTGAERTLGSGPSAVVATLSARGYAYVVEQIAPVDPDPGKLLIHVFAPACGP